ncbi:hypothetical protein [Paucisalibacillus sp. EB02]|uniref:hypothetical protein n=1 Tax=Paucisalibacillus sp. EB02 TaxID=1347087 RepID=UPI0004B3796D|nr:hypothetical protein [Paucisalibacillus sp. EB02]
MLKKIITAIISTLLFGTLMGFINYMTYTTSSFWTTMFFFAIYAAPVYLIGGIPISYLIDKLMKKMNFSSQLARHYTRYGLYILVGIFVAVIYKIILSIAEEEVHLFSQDLITYIVGGIIASLIFYYVSLLFDKKEAK